MKSLKFAEHLVPLVLSGQKTLTWRINDDKDLTVNDELSCRRLDGTEFTQAKILWIKLTTFASLTAEDRDGHESFASAEEMYKTYQGYYGLEVGPQTVLKIVKFQLI